MTIHGGSAAKATSESASIAKENIGLLQINAHKGKKHLKKKDNS